MRTKAISPVIATVIIVSVAIAIAVAVAFWMTGITGLFTRYEKLEVVNAYAIANSSSVGTSGFSAKNEKVWAIVLTVKNTGTSDATLDALFINGKPFEVFENTSLINATALTSENFTGLPSTGVVKVTSSSAKKPGDWTLPGGTYSLPVGKQVTLVIPIASGDGFSSGQIVEVKIHTAAGNEYPKSVQLP